MSQPEFLAWRAFYRQHPFDDHHRFHRPAAAVASTAGAKFEEVLQVLSPEPVLPGYSEAELNTFKAFGVKPPPRS